MTSKLARWTLLLQEFEFDILHRPVIQHAVVDYLSRLESGEEGTKVKHDFLDAQLCRADTIAAIEIDADTMDAWNTEMTIFLNIRLPPDNISLDGRK